MPVAPTLRGLREVYRGELLTGEADRLLYAYDAALDRARPDAIAVVRSAEETRQIVSWCARRKVPYVARGAGTNLSGGCIPLKGGIIISTAKLDRILAIDTREGWALVEPGLVNLRLQNELAKHGFFYAPDPASYKVCTIGGNIAENAGGPRCLKYGVTTNHIHGLEIAMPNGSLEYFSLDDAGPEIMSLLIGAEGTLGVVTKARVNILPLPQSVMTLLVAFKTLDDAMACVSQIIAAGILPRVLEAMDKMTVDSIEAYVPAGYPSAEAVLLIEIEGDPERVGVERDRIKALCEKRNAIEFREAADDAHREKLWEGRRSAYAALARLAPNVLVEDGVVPRQRLPEAAKRIQEIAARYDVKPGLLFHAGDGNLHPNIIFDERNQEQTRRVKQAGFEMLKACVELGGSISGEHGIGIDKRAAMGWLFPKETLELFRRLKRALDPDDLANPDKLFPLAGEAPPEGLRRPKRPKPSDAAQSLIERVRELAADGKPFSVVGARTKIPKARLPENDILSVRPLDKILEFDRDNYTATVEAGIPVTQLKKRLAEDGFYAMLPSVPGTLGGLLATKAWPGARDGLLGMRILLSDGSIVELGGKVVKNVAGYDVGRLLLGSWGTLAIILEATIKLYSAPPSIPTDIAGPKPFARSAWFDKIKPAFDPRGALNAWVSS